MDLNPRGFHEDLHRSTCNQRGSKFIHIDIFNTGLIFSHDRVTYQDMDAELTFCGSPPISSTNVFESGKGVQSSDIFKSSNEVPCSECSDYTQHIFIHDYAEERYLQGSKKYTNIYDFIESEEFVKKITAAVDVTIGELTLMLLKFSVANSLSAMALTNLFKLINSMFVETVLPDSKYFIDKVFNSENDAEFHAVCENCSAYIGKFGEVQNVKQCCVCSADLNLSNPSLSNFFITLDPSVQVSDILNVHENHYDYVVNRRNYSCGIIKDIYDGKYYRDFVESLPNEEKNNYVTFIFNTDGAPKFKSSQYSIWPLYLMINEISPQERLKNILVCGLWFNKKKPIMSVFLVPFVDLMNKLSSQGIECTIKGQQKCIKAYALECSVDAVARAPMQGIKQFNGSFGCNWCLHPGVFAFGCIRYSLLESVPEPRCKESTIEIMMQSLNPNTPTLGIKFPSPLINLKKFDIIYGFDPDYMHCCLEGVGSQITENILQFLNQVQLQLLDSNLERIAVPRQISRLTRPLSVRNDWKAREWENFILYYSIPLFILIGLDKQLLVYWFLFVESLYILLKDHIDVEELDQADKNLHEFVGKTEKIFGIAAMTYNVHQLLHISTSVFNWGPLWAHSTFPFESANYTLLKAVKCAKGVPQQIVRFVNISHNILLLTERVYQKASDTVKMYCTNTLYSKIKNIAKLTDITYLGKGEDIDDDLINQLQLSQDCQSYRRMIKDGCLYAISTTRQFRTNDAIAQINDGRFIKIVSFIIDNEKSIEIALCQVVHVEQTCGVLKTIIGTDQETIAIYTHQIRKICVQVIVGNASYLCPVPNLLHY